MVRSKTPILVDYMSIKSRTLQESATITGLLQRCSEHYPHNIAIENHCQRLSYLELYAKSRDLAAILAARGVKPGQPVAVFSKKSVNTMIGLYGIMLAGAAYVPLDLSDPQSRLLKILESCHSPLVVSDLETWEILGFDCPVGVVLVDQPGQAAVEFSHEVNAQDLAYIIFTSGTTGNPKGVCIEHRNVINFLAATHGVFAGDFSDTDTILTIVNLCFDVSVFELFLPLVSGARLVIAPEQATCSFQGLVEIIKQKGITTAYIPPAFLSNFIKELARDKRPCRLKKLIVGVEPIKHAVLDQYLAFDPEMKIVNGYGPTEATVFATYYRYEPHLHLDRPYIPIGKAVDNSNIYIVRKDFSLAQAGEPGELVIVGANLARGYLNDEILTAQKFPTLELAGAYQRAYLTGDLAQYLSDGNLLFLGRMGGYVKIDGYRIDLGEIETVLLKKLPIEKTRVVVRQMPQAGTVLVAYYVPQPDFSLTIREIRSLLKEDLPLYMIPKYFVALDVFPVNRNGKIDINQLPLPS